ncbi:MAG: hypothetical protein KKI08_10300 [Armatimonadetes bacterium]|nr:hypothetical protein [Armatimonadota bacterium]
MRRYIPLLILIVLGLAVGGWQLSRARRQPPPPPVKATPLEPTAPSVQAALAFLGAWSAGKTGEVYGMLSAGMKKSVSQADFAAMIADRKFTDPGSVAHVETAQAAYVISRVKAHAPAKGDQGFAGYSLLLTREGQAWKVAQIQEEEKLFEKYADLRLSPGKDGGWVVTYQNEKGQVMTITLPGV